MTLVACCVTKCQKVPIRLAQIWRSGFYADLSLPQSKSPINPVTGLWGFYSLLLTRLLNHSVKIGCIPIYIGIEFNFVLCESIVRWILSSHNDLQEILEHIHSTPFVFVNLIAIPFHGTD